MGLVEAKQFGVNAQQTRFGEPLMAQDGNGGTYGESPTYLVPETYNAPVTHEELVLVIDHGARKDIELGRLTYPPHVERTLQLASEFYDVYFSDTDVCRVEVIDRYAVALIEQLSGVARTSRSMDDGRIEQYVRDIHDMALAA